MSGKWDATGNGGPDIRPASENPLPPWHELSDAEMAELIRIMEESFGDGN